MAEHGDTIRLVPRDQDPFEETLELVEEHGWEETDEETWSVPDKDATVRHITDRETEVEFFTVTGADRQSVAKLLEDKIDMLEPSGFKAFLDQFQSAGGVRQGLY